MFFLTGAGHILCSFNQIVAKRINSEAGNFVYKVAATFSGVETIYLYLCVSSKQESHLFALFDCNCDGLFLVASVQASAGNFHFPALSCLDSFIVRDGHLLHHAFPCEAVAPILPAPRPIFHSVAFLSI